MIREARITDLESLQTFNKKLLMFQNNLYPLCYDVTWPFKDGDMYFRTSILDDYACALIAEEGEVIGYLIGWISEDPCRPGKQAEIENMFIEEEYRGKGVGKELVDAFKKWCEKHEVVRMRVTTLCTNEKAVNFYKKCGFSDCSVTLELHSN